MMWRHGRGGLDATAAAQAMAFVLPLAVYLRTLARDLTFVDSGELAAVATTLGIAHPPGYPLFTLLGHLASLLPLGSPIARVALLSAIATALATALLFRVAWSLVDLGGLPRLRHRLALAGTLAGSMLFAFSSTVWSQSVIVEVYALHGALAMALLAACLAAVENPRGRGWPMALLFFGLGLTHHLTAILLAPALLVTLIVMGRELRKEEQNEDGGGAGEGDGRRQGRGSWRWLRPLRVIWIAPLPLLLYAYLPLRSRQDPAINWDYPETLHRLWMHVSARQYQGHLGSQGMRVGELKRFFGEQLPGEATLLLPILALGGAIVLVRRRPAVLFVTAPVAAAFVLYNLAYPIADINVYYIPVLLVLALWAAVACGWLAGRAGRMRPAPASLVVAVLTAALLLPLVRNFRANDLSDYRDASWFLRDALARADSGSVVFSGDGSRFTSPVTYLQEVEGVRRDLVVVDLGRLASPQLARDLGKALPEVAAACQEELAAGAALARMAEAGQEYDVSWARGIYHTMQRQIARAAVRSRPTYAQGGTFQHQMFVGLQRHPEGLLVRLTVEPDYRPFSTPRFDGLERMLKLPSTAERRELLSEYHRMLDGRLRYLEHHQRAAEADSLREEIRRLFGASGPLPAR